MENKLYDRNIAKEWYEYGEKVKDDFFTKFMMHWIAFNWIYSSYEDANEEHPSEINAIRSCVSSNIDIFKRYNAFDCKEIRVFLQSPIKDERTGNKKIYIWNVLKNERKKDDERILALFESLYKVRCNLFHGSKSIRNDRDIELVKASSVILEGYLNELLDEYKNMRG